ncbi:LysR family transcriptional regulator [Rhizobium rhizogenes]|uniref:LysR family transcriptional regulator n=1 Tax=Rhizobium rhizogenes TaxID=359 RepID=UPI00080FC488|nr:LysR family transcriptional regulator [Rhizobium rhizogenes]NTI43780.1 LysR family transcriptional regulator [Rhizobium rhizogenes]OCJ18949.1 transcriptional regulator [Agrobacterium sp. B131/95]
MDRLTTMEMFVRVAQLGSFTATAKASGISTAMVSKHIQDLENRLAARLLERTTRSVKLTPRGQLFYSHCKNLIEQVVEAEQSVTRPPEPSGVLRIGAPKAFGSFVLMPEILRLLSLFPELKVALILRDNIRDPRDENLDIAISAKAPRDDDIEMLTMRPQRRIVCASPSFIDQGNDVSFESDGVSTDQHAERVPNFTGRSGAHQLLERLDLEDEEACLQAALLGAGAFELHEFLASQYLQDGRLLALSREPRIRTTNLLLLYEKGRILLARDRAFIDFAVAI